jgi:UDP-N-acetylmuramoyl-tripeptide--D-alanyl-D-alanine ligase
MSTEPGARWRHTMRETLRPEEQNLRVSTWDFGDIAEAIEGRLEGDPGVEDRQPAAVSTDTRSLESGDLFFALRGERFDGHTFLEEAVSGGACGVVVERDHVDVTWEVPTFRVDDTAAALGRLGAAIWQEATEEGLHSIAVTGSNGKTTTKELLATLWGSRGTVHATPGNLNNAIGLPLTLCGLPLQADTAILEMGANAPGEIRELIAMAPAAQRIITSIGYAHTEGFGSIEGVRRAKSEIAESADRDTQVIVPYTERTHLSVDAQPGRVATFGEEPGSDVRVVAYEAVAGSGARVELIGLGRVAHVELGLPGRHNARNLAAAIATLWLRGLDLRDRDLRRLRDELELPAGRWRVVEVAGHQIVDDAYNANPSSVRASAKTFVEWSSSKERRRVVVLATMLELGDAARRHHERVAVDLAQTEELDDLVFVGDHAEAMARAAEDVGRPDLEVYRMSGAEAIAEWLTFTAPSAVLLKGSRGAELESVIKMLKSGSVSD